MFGNGGSDSNNPTPVKVREVTKFRFVGVGERHSLAIDTNGSLHVAGTNTRGALGKGGRTPISYFEILDLMDFTD